MKLIWRRLDGQNSHEAGRQLLRELYRAEIGGEMPEILLTPSGKPYFPGNMPHFSISHTKNHVFCCLTDKNVGIDAEEADRSIDLHLAKRILSPTEQAKFDGTQEMLLKFWVLKEACAKLTGRGLGNYLKETDFDPKTVQIIDGCYVAVLEEDYAV